MASPMHENDLHGQAELVKCVMASISEVILIIPLLWQYVRQKILSDTFQELFFQSATCS